MASYADENPSIPPRKPMSVKCMPLPSMIKTMPRRSAQTVDRTLIMECPCTRCSLRESTTVLHGQSLLRFLQRHMRAGSDTVTMIARQIGRSYG